MLLFDTYTRVLDLENYALGSLLNGNGYRAAIGGMLTELEELEAPPIEFDEKLWYNYYDYLIPLFDI
jgi:hypothetical protein